MQSKPQPLTRYELSLLSTSKKKMIQQLSLYLSTSIHHLNSENNQEVEFYLNQAEKILQFAIQHYPRINQNWTLCVLHNQSVYYQAEWQLQKCSNCLEAIIFNINNLLKSPQKTPRISEKEVSSNNRISNLEHNYRWKLRLTKYYLQYCGVNSNFNNHEGALISARKAIVIARQTFKEYYKILKDTKSKCFHHSKKQKITKFMYTLNHKLDLQYYDEYIQSAKFYLFNWNSKDYKQKKQGSSIIKSILDFNISDILKLSTLQPDSLKINSKDKPLKVSQKCIYITILLYSLCFFIVAAELRFIAIKNANQEEEDKKDMLEYKQSEIYHLFSIIIIAVSVPFSVPFLDHLLTSYKNHYGSSLLESLSQPQYKPYFTELLFIKTRKTDKQRDVSIQIQSKIDRMTSKKSLKSKISKSKSSERIILDQKKKYQNRKSSVSKGKNKDKEKRKSKSIKLDKKILKKPGKSTQSIKIETSSKPLSKLKVKSPKSPSPYCSHEDLFFNVKFKAPNQCHYKNKKSTSSSSKNSKSKSRQRNKISSLDSMKSVSKIILEKGKDRKVRWKKAEDAHYK